MISIICVYNNKEILENYLIKSLKCQTNDYELVLVNSHEHHFSSASQALNYGASKAKGDILVFAHQDIEFISNDAIEKIQHYSENSFGIAGVAGRCLSDKKVYSSVIQGPQKKIAGIKINDVCKVDSLDECLLIIKKDSFHGFFDYGSWHFYGVDYSLESKEENKEVLVFPIDVYHLSPGWSLNNSYWKTLKKVSKRHKEWKKIPTTMSIYNNNIFLPIEILLRKIKMKLIISKL